MTGSPPARGLLPMVAIAAILAGVALWFLGSGNDGGGAPRPALEGPGAPVATGPVLDGVDAAVRVVVDDPPTPVDPMREAAPEVIGSPGDGSLWVRVVGEDGAPRAGVTVRLWTPPGSNEPEGEERTDARGEARFSLADVHSSQQCEVDLDAVLAGRGVTPVGFLAGAPPVDGVTFVLPDTGGLEVTLLGEDADPWSDGAAAELWVRPRTGEVRREHHPSRPSARGGVLRWDAVAVGRELALVLEVGHARVAVADLAGPRTAGDVARFRLVVADHLSLLHLRVLGPDGAPLRDAPLAVRAGYDLGASRVSRPAWTTRTDDEGRVVLPVGPGAEDPYLVALEVVDAGALLDGPPESRPRASVTLPDPRTPGSHVLGDVRLRDPAEDPLLLRGVVLDPKGDPLHFARVQLARPGNPGSPIHGAEFEGHTAMDGTFELRGRWPGEPVVLLVYARDHAPARLAVVEGQTVDVRLANLAWVRGEVLLDPGLPATRLMVEARPTGAPFDGRPKRVRVSPDGTFSLGSATPGEYDLSVRSDGSEQVLWSRGAVPLVSTEPGAAPALEPIDLRGTLRTQRVRLEFAVAPAYPNGRVRILDGPGDAGSGTDDDGPWAPFWGDHFELLVPLGPVDLDLRVEGHLPLRLEGLTEDQRVLLQAPVPCTLRLVPEGPLPEGALALAPFLVAANPSERARAAWESAVPLRGIQEYALDGLAPGPWRLGLRVTRRLGSDTYSHGFHGPTSPAFTLRPEHVGTVVELRVPAAAIEAALRGE